MKKFKAFGKVTVSNNGKEDNILENLYMKRKHLLENEKVEQAEDVEVCINEKRLDRKRSEYEEKLKNLNDLKANKGNHAFLFKLETQNPIKKL